MTRSTHTYTAVLIGLPDVALSVRGGRITLDSGRAPHVQGTLDIAFPAQSTLNALDPRLNARIRVTADAVFPTFSQSRTFNLGLRARPTRHRTAVVSLELASDEALLSDYAPLADDLTPYSHQASLRAIVNYALGKAIPGATLAAVPTGNASVATPSDAVNMIPDPSFEGDGSTYVAINCNRDIDTSWAAHGARSVNVWGASSAASCVSIGGDTGGMRLGLQAGRSYVLSATGRVKSAVGGSADPNARRVVVMYRSGTGAYQAAASSALPTTVGTATRVSVTVTLPATATEAFVRAYLGHTVGEVQWDAFRLSEKPIDPTDTATTYFDGGTADTATYQYDWSGDANKSVSRRTSLIDRAPDTLLWKAGVSALNFVHSLVQAAGYRLVCDETRTWTLRSAEYVAAGNLTFANGVDLVDATDTLSRESTWFDAQVTRYTWTDPDGTRQERIDSFALTATPTRVNLVEVAAPFPGVGRSEYAVRRAQGRGREVSATKVADWTARAEAPVIVLLDGAATQTGLTESVDFDLDNDEITVTTRTTDTLPGSIDLLGGTIDSLVGMIDAL